MVEVLRRGFDAGLCLDGAPECVDCHFGEDIEREEVALIALDLRVGDAERDAPGDARALGSGQLTNSEGGSCGTYIVT